MCLAEQGCEGICVHCESLIVLISDHFCQIAMLEVDTGEGADDRLPAQSQSFYLEQGYTGGDIDLLGSPGCLQRT